MKVEFINPFFEGAQHVLKMVLNTECERGDLSARPQIFTSQQVNIVCGITGQLEGQVIYGLSKLTADKIASRMLMQPVKTFDQLAASAIAELGNMISGNCMTLLAGKNYTCDITPPTIIKGTNVRMCTTDAPALVIPMQIQDFGVFEITISLRERLARAA